MYQIIRTEPLLIQKTTKRKKTKTTKNKEDKKRREDGLALNKPVLPEKDFRTKCSYAASSEHMHTHVMCKPTTCRVHTYSQEKPLPVLIRKTKLKICSFILKYFNKPFIHIKIIL